MSVKRQLKRAAFASTDKLYRVKNRRRAKVLVYTDSRGENLTSRWGKTGYGTYITRLRAKYRLTYALCPESYTTIPDFLNFVDRLRVADYDAILMHCGIVDFSPRPLSSIEKLKKSKSMAPRFTELFAENESYYSQPFDCVYDGEPTVNIYSPRFLERNILPELLAVPRLIWVNANHFVPGWDGNYQRGRPSNINEVVSIFDETMQKHLPSVVDLKGWTASQVKKFTIDNIHFTKQGFKQVFGLIDSAIESTIEQSQISLTVASATATTP